MRLTLRTTAKLTLMSLAVLAQACIAAGGGGSGGGGGNGLPGGVTPTDATGDSGSPVDTIGGDGGASGSDVTTGDGQPGGDATTSGTDAGANTDGAVPNDTGNADGTVVDAVVTDSLQDSGSDSGKTDSGSGEIGPPQDAKDSDVFFPDSSEVGPQDVNTDAFGSQSCCMTSNTPGCADKKVAVCVCAQDPFCCNNSWDAQCANEVNKFGCGFCSGGPDGGGNDGGMTEVFIDSGKTDAFDGGKPDVFDGGSSDVKDADSSEVVNPGANACCEASAQPGCIDPAIMQCVCAIDSYCCATAWDNICVDEVTSEGCGQCAGGADGGGSGPDAGF